jgi:hypothetical protein
MTDETETITIDELARCALAFALEDETWREFVHWMNHTAVSLAAIAFATGEPDVNEWRREWVKTSKYPLVQYMAQFFEE